MPDIKLAIEFNGMYWHSDEIMSKRNRFFNTAEEHHNYKTKLCKDKNIKLIHINQSNYIKNKSKELNKVKTVVTKLCELLESYIVSKTSKHSALFKTLINPITSESNSVLNLIF